MCTCIYMSSKNEERQYPVSSHNYFSYFLHGPAASLFKPHHPRQHVRTLCQYLTEALKSLNSLLGDTRNKTKQILTQMLQPQVTWQRILRGQSHLTLSWKVDAVKWHIEHFKQVKWHVKWALKWRHMTSHPMRSCCLTQSAAKNVLTKTRHLSRMSPLTWPNSLLNLPSSEFGNKVCVRKKKPVTYWGEHI